MGRRAVGQAKRAAHPLDRELDDARRQRPASRADEKRAIGRQVMRAEVQIGFDGRADRRDHRRRARLPALAQTVSGIAAAAGRVAAADAERLGNAQARAIEQGEHGGVAGEDPGRRGPLRPGADASDVAAPTARRAAWAGSRAIFGERTRREGGGASLVLALQMAREGPQPASCRISERLDAARRAAAP